jgi:hypothetical protein
VSALDDATRAVEKAQRDFEASKANWEAAISRRLRLEADIAARPTMVYSSLNSPNYGQLVPRDTPGERSLLAQLRAAEEEARRAMDAAGDAVVKAREAERRAHLAAAGAGH